ncbi:MAG TPA: hypothetical protein VJ044_14120 [Candidatus Hodarchaeales archaeon]|nr:hypothetical protein [Candidatus Hodarchaeales archaeon]
MQSIRRIFSRSPNIKLEYLMIFQQSGIPIYSKCWGDFCALLVADESLLSGFLAAITTMPKMFGKGEANLQSIDMGFTKLAFNFTSPSGHVMVVGFPQSSGGKQSEKYVKILNNRINAVIEEEYKGTKWEFLSTEELKGFETKLLQEIVYPWLHMVSNQAHDLNCTMCIDAVARPDTQGKRRPIWETLSETYSSIRKMVMSPEGQEGKRGAEGVRAKWQNAEIYKSPKPLAERK